MVLGITSKRNGSVSPRAPQERTGTGEDLPVYAGTGNELILCNSSAGSLCSFLHATPLLNVLTLKWTWGSGMVDEGLDASESEGES